MKLERHKEQVKKSEPAYIELDSIFENLKQPELHPTTEVNHDEEKSTEPSTIPVTEKSESSTMTPFKKLFGEISGGVLLGKRMIPDFDKYKSRLQKKYKRKDGLNPQLGTKKKK